eukprot:CAMPEP_0197059882 /NCGR_PEP_ID=MMETSP1384-20130603/121976_1 /TAXON_ID=29189 /ORGANISM="Ammonia sp." /LENGTH=72 /DNA_ID=CAMNT_0042495083 /DNA_START=66 /DNA_END=280 /DNA_ORIENTATION=+
MTNASARTSTTLSTGVPSECYYNSSPNDSPHSHSRSAMEVYSDGEEHDKASKPSQQQAPAAVAMANEADNSA